MMTDTINMLDHALALAAKGFKVFPLQPNGKLPIWEGWPDRATTDAATIRGWWSDPLTGGSKPYNVGVCTSGLLVTDPDAKGGKPGLVNWEINDAIFGTPDHPVAITPTGGQHHFFKLPAGINPETVGNIADSAKRESPLGKGIDARSWHGFVVGAGSVIDGVPYRWQAEAASVADLPDAPDWIIDKCKRQVVERPDTTETPEGLTLDTPAALHRATWYLQHEAPEAVEGDGGDSTAFSVACHVRDYGVSREMALELLLDHWNDRCCPPWSPEDLELKVGNAYKYAREQIGCASAETQFEPLPDQGEAIDVPIERAASTASRHSAPAPRRLPENFDPAKLPAFPWVIGTRLMRGAVTAGIGAPKAGKSSLAMVTGAAIATGLPLTGEKVHIQGRVWIHNNEDHENVIMARVAALCALHGISFDSIRDRFLFSSGLDHKLVLATKGRDGVAKTAAVAEMIEFIKAEEVVYIAIDPFVSIHRGVSENANEEVEQVMDAVRDIAHGANVAIDLIHHTVKDRGDDLEHLAGNLAVARGAGAIGGAVRGVYTVIPMGPKSAEAAGIEEEKRGNYVRLDVGSGNLTGKSEKPIWFEHTETDISGKKDATDGENLTAEGWKVSMPVLFDMDAKRSDTSQAKRDAKLDENMKLAEAVALAVPSTGQINLGALALKVMSHTGLKERATADKIQELIGGGFSWIVGRQVWKLTQDKQGKHQSAPVIVKLTREDVPQ